jgi:hypothetical protein
MILVASESCGRDSQGGIGGPAGPGPCSVDEGGCEGSAGGCESLILLVIAATGKKSWRRRGRLTPSSLNESGLDGSDSFESGERSNRGQDSGYQLGEDDMPYSVWTRTSRTMMVMKRKRGKSLVMCKPQESLGNLAPDRC